MVCSSKYSSGATGGNGGYINATVNCFPGQQFEIFNGKTGIVYNTTLDIPDYGCGSTASSIYATSGTAGENSYVKDLTSMNTLLSTNGGGAGGGAYAYLPYMSSYTYNTATPANGSAGTYFMSAGNGAFLVSATSGGGNPYGTSATTTIEW